MNTRIRRIVASLVFGFVWVLSTVVAAQEKQDAAFEKIEGFLKENTYLLIHVDLNRIDIDGIFDQLQPRVLSAVEKIAALPNAGDASPPDEMKADAEESLKMERNQFSRFVEGLKSSNVEDFFILGQMETMQTIPLVFLFPGVSSLSDEIVQMLDMMDILPAGGVDNDLFFCLMAQRGTDDPKSFFTVFHKLRTKERPEFDKALRLQKKSPLRIVFAPSMGMKGLAQMMIPAMLTELPPGAIDSKGLATIIQKTESISAGLNLAEPRLNLAVQYPSEDDARKTVDFIVKTVDSVMEIFAQAALEGMRAGMGAEPTEEMKAASAGQTEAIKEMIVAELPKVNKDRLIYVVNAEKLDQYEEMLIGLLYPAITAARRAAVRAAGHRIPAE